MIFHIFKRDDKGDKTTLKTIKIELSEEDAIKTCQELNNEYFGTGYAPYIYVKSL